MYKVMPIC